MRILKETNKYSLLLVLLFFIGLSLTAQNKSVEVNTTPFFLKIMKKGDLGKRIIYHKKDSSKEKLTDFVDVMGKMVEAKTVTQYGKDHLLLSKEKNEWKMKEVFEKNAFHNASKVGEIKTIHQIKEDKPALGNDSLTSISLKSNSIRLSNVQDDVKVKIYNNKKEFSLWTILFLCIAIQGFFLMVLLMFKKRKLKSNFFLSLFIMCFSLILLLWIGQRTNLTLNYPNLYFIYYSLPLLLGPLMLFYSKNFFKLNSIKSIILHLLPFVVLIAYFLPFYVLSFQEKTEVLTNGTLRNMLFQWDFIIHLIYPLHLVSFLFYSIQTYKLIKKRKESTIEKKLRVDNYISKVYIFFNLFAISALINYVLIKLFNTPIVLDFLGGVFIALLVYYIGYLLVNGDAVVETLEKKVFKKYKQSSLDVNKISALSKRLIYYIESEKPYLKFDYKLNNLSTELNIPSHHISEILSGHYKKNFSELINSYRIEEAKKILATKQNHKAKIDSVAYDVGFSSRTTFYFWFKRITGTTPSEYQKKMSNLNST